MMKRSDMEYLSSVRNYILAVVVVFIVSMIIGTIVSLNNPGLAESYLNNFEKSFSWIKSLSPAAILLVIFLNNASKSLMALLLGLGFGIIPILFVAGNGIILSMLAEVVSRHQGVLFVIAAILPHGIIEIPMILISAGIGLRLGHVVYLSARGAKAGVRSELKKGIFFYIKWVVPLLFVAAFIETFVTTLILYWLFPDLIMGM
ncbi:MAG: stage II sporulation protein M [Candidatus Methanoperedens sp.]|nr:stage II sporulation protein M [Candidatus Methanoperedens sp.]MCZ7360256.1 stage II sporulation protein M [Candidatus Methanoperedens sp.]HLB71000.1 stage II sporulation protein M [Candidatus Methanoperedens sp.]